MNAFFCNTKHVHIHSVNIVFHKYLLNIHYMPSNGSLSGYLLISCNVPDTVLDAETIAGNILRAQILVELTIQEYKCVISVNDKCHEGKICKEVLP